MDKIITTREQHIFTITINRPQVRNCIDGETAELLAQAWQNFRDDDDLYVAIITGAGDKAFCSGADLKQLATLGPGPTATPEQRRRFITHGSGYLGYTRQSDIYKPIIAAVNGYAVAGGLEIACLADIRIAAENAQFAVSCRRWGVPLVDGGTQRLPRIVGMGRALDMIITGRDISATEGYQLGLVNKVVPTGNALAEATTWATQICQFPQQALRTDKQAALMGYGCPLVEGLRIEAEVGQTALESLNLTKVASNFDQRNKL